MEQEQLTCPSGQTAAPPCDPEVFERVWRRVMPGDRPDCPFRLPGDEAESAPEAPPAVPDGAGTALAVPATILFILGILALAYTVRQDLPWSPYHALPFLALAAGLLGFVYTLSMLEAYELLVHNDQHTQTFLFRLRRKLQSKLDA